MTVKYAAVRCESMKGSFRSEFSSPVQRGGQAPAHHRAFRIPQQQQQQQLQGSVCDAVFTPLPTEIYLRSTTPVPEPTQTTTSSPHSTKQPKSNPISFREPAAE